MPRPIGRLSGSIVPHFPSPEDRVQTVRCPKCRKDIFQPTGEEVVHCPHCGADLVERLGRKMVTIDSEKYLEPGEVDLTEDEAERRWAENHPDYASETRIETAESNNLSEDTGGTVGAKFGGSPSKKGKVSWAICNACQAIITHPSARFCPSCGADLSSGAKGETLLDLHGEGDKCIVCRAAFREGDMALRCLHCGRLAHRSHLLEWLHAKDFCPACRAKLDEDELIAQLGYITPTTKKGGIKK